MLEPSGREARDLFLRRYRDDLERGALGDVAHYQALFPGFEADIAEEYALLEDEGSVSRAESDPTDDAFGPYRILGELGRGGQAIVFLAEDSRLSRRVALKVLRGSALAFGTAADRRRFEREAQVSAQLDHPGICSVYEAGEVDGTPYIAMRYVEGETLARRIAATREGATSTASTLSSRRREEVDWLLRVGERCARALHFAHERGLVHRDVKPGNVMITPDGEPVLLDFGLAHVATEDHSLTASGTAMGTPYYMAPEQVRGEVGAIDGRTDVYALGVALYEAFTGQRPFEAPTRDALYRQVLMRDARGVRSIDPRLPRDLEIVLETAIHKERDRRYATAEAFAADLGRVQRREPILARPAGPLTRAWSWARRRPAVASLLALLSVVIVVAVALLEQRRHELQEKVDEFTRLADMRELRLLQEQVKSLPAVRPTDVKALDRWIAEAESLTARLPLHRTTRARLAAGEDHDTVAVRWQLDALDDLVREIERFAQHELPLERGRRDYAVAAARLSLEEPGLAWQETIHAVADRDRSPGYGGLTIAPQIGLVPLGRDPESGLFEFAHLASGAAPVRAPDGRLAIGDDTGIVFVLLPGGTFKMGAERPDAGHTREAPNVDLAAEDPEAPVHEVTLAPFFLAKFELTQGQWLRLTGENPSQLAAGQTSAGGESFTLRHPVDTVSHNHCRELFALVGLELPTEAQWEYAARGGTGSVWWCGDDPRTLARCANLLDRNGLDAMHRSLPEDSIENALDDGHGFAAAVGSYAPNPFGLHDVIGNVTELVAGDPLYYTHPVRAGDGMRLELDGSDANGQRQIIRGGDWGSSPFEARAATRRHCTPDTASAEIGVRPARPVED